MTLKPITVNGMLKDVNDNFAAIAPIGGDNGIGNLRVARFTYDLSVEGNRSVGAHGTGVKIPANAIIVGGFLEVITAITGDTNATLAVHAQAANDIQTAAAVSGAPWSTQGRKAIVPKANTPESTGIKTTAEREVTFTVATAALLTGKVVGYLYFVEGLAPTA